MFRQHGWIYRALLTSELAHRTPQTKNTCARDTIAMVGGSGSGGGGGSGGCGATVEVLGASECSPDVVREFAALMWSTPEFAWAHNAVDGLVDRNISETVARMQEEVTVPDSPLQSDLKWHIIRDPGTGKVAATAKTFVRCAHRVLRVCCVPASSSYGHSYLGFESARFAPQCDLAY